MIWYYEHPLPADRKYSKTKPLEFEEFQPLLAWWDNRVENDRAWKLPFPEILRGLEEKAKLHWDAVAEAKAEADRFRDRIEKLEKCEKPDETEIEELRGMERVRRERAREEASKGRCPLLVCVQPRPEERPRRPPNWNTCRLRN